MNLIDCYVVEVKSKPQEDSENQAYFHVVVSADCYGRIADQVLSFKTLEQALNVKPGYHFLS